MTPWGEDAQKHDTWTSPRPCPCVSTLFWFCFVSFCSNKMVTIGYSAFMRSVSHSSKLLKLRSWWEPRNLQLVSCGGLCLSRVKFGLTQGGQCQKSKQLPVPPSPILKHRHCNRNPWSRVFKSLPPEHWKEGSQKWACILLQGKCPASGQVYPARQTEGIQERERVGLRKKELAPNGRSSCNKTIPFLLISLGAQEEGKRAREYVRKLILSSLI